MKSLLRTSVLLLLSFVLAACFGGGGGGDTVTYTIGGTVTGLAGSGLVLQNNGGDDTVISTNGDFTFVATLVNGSDYSVTVLTQPSSPNQICTVTNGSDTLSGNNITNISVTCVTNTYTIGGLTTGLAGSGLMLQNNDTDNLPVTTNDSFTFATAITDGLGYSVSVLTQPTSPSQTCMVNNGSGNVGGANVTDVTITCVDNYNIDVTINGLTGTGLVLQNNSTNDLSITADGTFTFTKKIADGFFYNVTIKTQPTGQVCPISGGSGIVSGADVTDITITCLTPLGEVAALYSFNGANWNDYVRGGDISNATDDTCFADTDTACLHAGEIRFLDVTGRSSCTGLSAEDSLGVFDWSCDISTGTARFISTRLKDGKGLSNLIDFYSPGWKENSLTIYDGANVYATSTVTTWWTNPVVTNTTGGVLDVAGTVYVLPSSTVTTAYEFTASSIALVARREASVVINGPAAGNSSYVIKAANKDFLWIEGMEINATGDDVGIYWDTVRFSAMRNLKAKNADTGTLQRGIHLLSSSNNTLSNVTAIMNGNIGIHLFSSSNNTLSTITVGYSTLYGVDLYSSSNNILSNVTAYYNEEYGIYLRDSSNNNTLTNVETRLNNYGVYLNTSSNNNTISNLTTSRNYTGVMLYSSSNNELSDINVDGNTQGLELDFYSNDNTLSNMTINNNSYDGVELRESTGNSLSDITVIDNGSYGVLLSASSNNTLSNVNSSNNGIGIYLGGSSNNNILSGLSTSNNINHGIQLWGSSGNTFSDVIASNNSHGVQLRDTSNYNMFSDIIVSNNGSTGVFLLSFSDNNTFSGITTSNNRNIGVYLQISSNNTFSDVTTVNNVFGVIIEGGIVNNTLFGSNNNTLSGVTASNNELYGFRIAASSDNNTFSNVTASNNGQYGIYLYTSENYFTGKLKVGNNATANCSVSSGETNPGLIDSTCANNGSSDATLTTTGITIANSFIGKVTLDDAVNTSDANGFATITDFDLAFDWTNFENSYRSWGVDGDLFPDITNQGNVGCSEGIYPNQTDCDAASGTWISDARIWDWSMLATDTIIKDVISLPTGNDTLTHTWSDVSTSTILRNAVEIMDDGIGNDDTLCEANETCLYTPNMGSYQGHGNLISAGSIGTGGTLENIILMKYETNGY